jgi:hypothetical protein
MATSRNQYAVNRQLVEMANWLERMADGIALLPNRGEMPTDV